jgi:hypothetical protein|uniref:Uncharacterized protein n=1 Tax=Dechloromonas aromatica (strain RCB) TaxID=159087 RepID=Q47CP5_DECAR
MPRPLLTLTLFGLLAYSGAWAQNPQAATPLPSHQAGTPVPRGVQPSDNVPLADYLALLRQIAPAAEAGARDYLAAFAQRCGRPLTPAELRRAMADGDGDPALMALIRANHLGDTAGRQQLAGQIRCPGKAAR